jgi:hypothetical protein
MNKMSELEYVKLSVREELKKKTVGGFSIFCLEKELLLSGFW